MLLEREKIAVHGIVQGVGFRPFIHKLVQEYGLRGFIKNTSSGVELELEGERETLERFTEALPLRAPKLAVIESVEAEFTAELKNYPDFRILKSKTEEFRNTLISPDICICDDCLRELRDRNDRSGMDFDDTTKGFYKSIGIKDDHRALWLRQNR